MPGFDPRLDPQQQELLTPPLSPHIPDSSSPATAQSAPLHGPGGDSQAAASIQSHWADGHAGAAPHAAEEPAAGGLLSGSASDHQELTKALDAPSEDHAEQATAELLAAPKPAAKAPTEGASHAEHAPGATPTPTSTPTASSAPHDGNATAAGPTAAPTTPAAAAAAATPAPELTVGDTATNQRTFTDKVYKHNLANVSNAKVAITDKSMQGDLAAFKKNWDKNHGRYEAVSAQTGVPAKLIAALHWRESSGNFNTYLHQGDPLGKPAVHWPRNIPIFYKWEEAAVHALNMKKGIKNDLGMNGKTTDLAAMATYAECYNGLGYYNHGKNSPYVYSGTNQYSRGKYVGDGVYNSQVRDQQLGVVAMLESISNGVAKPTQTPAQPGAAQATTPAAHPATTPAAHPATTPAAHPATTTAAPVAQNYHVVRLGDQGDEVREVQQLLIGLGAQITADGDYGPGTAKAVSNFQRHHGLEADGMAGAQTIIALKAAQPAATPVAQQAATPAAIAPPPVVAPPQVSQGQGHG